jgi:predicted small secreted protein
MILETPVDRFSRIIRDRDHPPFPAVTSYTRPDCGFAGPRKFNRSLSMKNLRPWLLLLAVGLAFSLSACNTVQGAGKDIKKAGEAIEDAAK